MSLNKKNAVAFALAGLIMAGCAASAVGQNRNGPPTRVHTATTSQDISPFPATQNAGTSIASISTSGSTRSVTANGIPSHLVGSFPNGGNPHAIETQSVSLQVPLSPAPSGQIKPVGNSAFGVSLEGVVFDPFAAEFWQGDRSSGWNYDALGGAVALGVDANYAHVQPDGTYHYHGIPFGLLEMIRYDSGAHSPLVGYAADGYPIYAITGIIDGELTQVQSSYVLKAGERPGGSEPDGTYDGAFVEDYEYVAGLGDLDQCNGAFTVSAEYPGGTYAYFLTEDFPVVPRCFVGTPDASFQKGR